ncbi:MAG: ATP-binding protein, partial [Thermodesulfobacteriota bacterium]
KRVSTFYKNGKEDARQIMRQLMEKGEIKIREMQFLRSDGEPIDVILSASLLKDESGKTVGTLGIFKDITDKKRLEEQIQQSQKLESIGTLAGGIAHDFNNLLTAILGNISLAKMYSKAEGKVQQLLNESERACGRAKELTERLITFSKGGAPVKRVASIDPLLRDTISLVLMGSNISCEFQIPKDLWQVEFNSSQFKQLFSNITANAKEAMPRGGTLKIMAKNIAVERKRSDLPEGLPLGKFVQISFQDQGIGISKTNLPKVFDPYFSTKEMGTQRGVGLGLTSAYSIVKKHDGFIHIESREGAGTTVHIFLPAFEEKPMEVFESLPKTDGGEIQKGKILFMDDEEIVREVVGEMLKQIGYSVKFAKDGSEAVELYQKAKGAGHPFQAVILDVTVRAGMGAKETMKRLQEIDPEVKAFVSSGYTDEPVMVDFGKYGFKGSLSKPFNINRLQEVLTHI